MLRKQSKQKLVLNELQYRTNSHYKIFMKSIQAFANSTQTMETYLDVLEQTNTISANLNTKLQAATFGVLMNIVVISRKANLSTLYISETVNCIFSLFPFPKCNCSKNSSKTSWLHKRMHYYISNIHPPPHFPIPPLPLPKKPKSSHH